MTEFERDPEMQVGDFYDLPRSQIRERIMKRVMVSSKLLFLIIFIARHQCSDIICLPIPSPYSVHGSIF